MEEVGRNRPCPCGSGKKFKHCHGKVTASASDHVATVPDDMRNAVDDFYREAEEVVDSFGRKLEQEPPPDLIYHYTNDAGLRGILKTGTLWLTDIFDLNDPTELHHGMMPAIDIMKYEAVNGRPEVKRFAENMIAMLESGIRQVANYFVCSFSRAGDDLGQWRAYADDGRGYAIGFDGKALETAFTHSNGKPVTGPITFPVTYEVDHLHQMQQQIIGKAIALTSLPRGRSISNRAINDFMRELSVCLTVPLLRSAFFFKHPAYRNEQEYRFMLVHKMGDIPGLRLRGQSASLRYIEFDWRSVAADSLNKIVVGPAADRMRAHSFASNCVGEFCPTSGPVEIVQSQVPYRALRPGV